MREKHSNHYEIVCCPPVVAKLKCFLGSDIRPGLKESLLLKIALQRQSKDPMIQFSELQMKQKGRLNETNK